MENQQKALLLLEIAREDKKEKKEETNKQTKTKNTNIYWGCGSKMFFQDFPAWHLELWIPWEITIVTVLLYMVKGILQS